MLRMTSTFFYALFTYAIGTYICIYSYYLLLSNSYVTRLHTFMYVEHTHLTACYLHAFISQCTLDDIIALKNIIIENNIIGKCGSFNLH